MKILITSGGTKEYIDDVRVLTNISSGALGAKIAESFTWDNHEVHYVYTKGSVLPRNDFKDKTRLFFHVVKDVVSLVHKTAELIPEMDVIIHAMAVSDFGFSPCKEKLKSNSTEDFINSLRDRITVNPKVLSHMRDWNPKAVLISFKFEVGKTNEDLLDIARKSLIANRCDIVVANDKTEMVKEGKHIVYIQDVYKNVIKCDSKENIARQLVRIVNETKGNRTIEISR